MRELVTPFTNLSTTSVYTGAELYFSCLCSNQTERTGGIAVRLHLQKMLLTSLCLILPLSGRRMTVSLTKRAHHFFEKEIGHSTTFLPLCIMLYPPVLSTTLSSCRIRCRQAAAWKRLSGHEKRGRDVGCLGPKYCAGDKHSGGGAGRYGAGRVAPDFRYRVRRGTRRGGAGPVPR